jgi:hypothetical protein
MNDLLIFFLAGSEAGFYEMSVAGNGDSWTYVFTCLDDGSRHSVTINE